MGEMLNDLIFSVNTILPVFIVVAIGYFMRRRGTCLLYTSPSPRD